MSVVILAGGEARRAAGANKSLIAAEGKPIIEWQLERLHPVFGNCITVVTDRPADFTRYGLNCIPDLDLPGLEGVRCSMRGILSALTGPPPGWRFVLACDMPWPDLDILRRQWEIVKTGGSSSAPEAMGVCLRTADGVQPYHALYHSSLAESVRAALMDLSRNFSLRRWIEITPKMLTVTAEQLGAEQVALDRCLANFNTMESAAALRSTHLPPKTENP
ncbi:NTP transferase domain-containing protein [Candidatus Sumerlaeota bacterium]|nr:NTP transferase domain-containing protein [Candidatus Sumerlaeota bacterium]